MNVHRSVDVRQRAPGENTTTCRQSSPSIFAPVFEDAVLRTVAIGALRHGVYAT
jgi:hypothetical protein